MHTGAVMRRKQHPGLIGQAAQRHLLLRRQRVVFRQCQHHAIEQERQDLQALLRRHRQHHHAHVGAVIAQCDQLLGGRRLLQMKLRLRVRLTKLPQDARQQSVYRAVDEGQAQRFGQTACRTAGIAEGAFKLRQRSPRLNQKHLPCFGDPGDAVAALQQQHAQLLLNLSDSGSQRGLCHMQALGGAVKAHFFRDGNKLPQLA
ncbi:hypothetical protein D3C73_939990 [compost metagenome]